MKRIIRTAVIAALLVIAGYPMLPVPAGNPAHPPGTVLTGTARAASSPDLVIESIAWSPENPSMGDTVIFTVTVRNQGSDPAGNSSVAYYIDDAYLTAKPVGPLGAGTAEAGTFTWKATAGQHTVKAVADADGAVAESDETNNQAMFYFSALAPDLIVEKITWTPENPSRGDTIAFNIAVKNQGTKPVNASLVYFYLDGSSRGSREVPRLDAGATSNQTFAWSAQAGSHELRAVVDEFDFIREGDESNNEKTLTFITLAPDLIVEAITWSPESPSESENVTFTANITNQGSGRADYSTLAYYIDGEYLGSLPVNPIEAGVTDNKTFSWIAESGAHEIKAITDFLERVFEDNESNNETTVLFAPLIPDLIIGAITWSPASPSIGETVTFSVPVRNQGNGRAGTSRVYFYVDGSPRGDRLISSIDGESTSTQTFSWEAVSGTHTIKAVADKDDQVMETDENNNEQSVIFSWVSFADLIIEDITWLPASPAIGETVTSTISIKNQGSGRADFSRVGYYLDGELMPSISVNPIDAGATESKTFSWTAVVGQHEIKAVADANEKVTEDSEDNNEKVVSITPRAPDFRVETISPSTAEASAGETVDFTVTVQNRGELKTDASRVYFYVDGASLGYQELAEIDAAATVSKIFTWTSKDGAHEIKAIVDPSDSVTETDENNNQKTIIFAIPPPDLVIDEMTVSPEEPMAGDNITVMVTIKNQGDGPAAPTLANLYNNGSPITTKNVPEIDPGAVSTETFTVTAWEGDNAIEVVVDSEQSIAESNEANNKKLVILSVLPPPVTNPGPATAPPPPTPRPPEDSVFLDIQSAEVTTGQDIVLGISASNLVSNPAMTVKAVLVIPSGLSLISDNFTKNDDEQYTIVYNIAPGDMRQIEIRLKSNQAGDFNIFGELSYYFEENETVANLQIFSFPVTVSAVEIPAQAPEPLPSPEENFFSDWRMILGIIAVAGLLITLYVTLRRQ